MNFFFKDSHPSAKQGAVSPKLSKRMLFVETGVKKYRFTLSAEMGLGAMQAKTLTETYWMLQVLKITENGYIIELLAYDTNLKECNNEGLKEMFHITRHFQRLYDELKVEVDLKGNLIRVINVQRLIDKWKQIKDESVQYFNEDTTLDQFFAVSDDQFSSPEFMTKLVREAEFFFVYLQMGRYGQKFNPMFPEIIKRNNALKTENIDWGLHYSGSTQAARNGTLGEMEVRSKFDPGRKWLDKAYGKMTFIDLGQAMPRFSIQGHYQFHNQTGWLRQAELLLEEVVHPKQLYHRMEYKIEEIKSE